MGPSGLLTLPSRAPLQPTEPSGLLSELGSLHGHPPTDLPAQKVPSSFKLPSSLQSRAEVSMSSYFWPVSSHWPSQIPAHAQEPIPAWPHSSSPWQPQRCPGRRFPDLHRITCSHFPCKPEQGHLY